MVIDCPSRTEWIVGCADEARPFLFVSQEYVDVPKGAMTTEVFQGEKHTRLFGSTRRAAKAIAACHVSHRGTPCFPILHDVFPIGLFRACENRLKESFHTPCLFLSIVWGKKPQKFAFLIALH